MKKIFFIILIIILFSSCNTERGDTRKDENNIYEGPKWEIVKLNDTTFLAVPGLNASKNSIPQTIKIK